MKFPQDFVDTLLDDVKQKDIVDGQDSYPLVAKHIDLLLDVIPNNPGFHYQCFKIRSSQSVAERFTRNYIAILGRHYRLLVSTNDIAKPDYRNRRWYLWSKHNGLFPDTILFDSLLSNLIQRDRVALMHHYFFESM